MKQYMIAKIQSQKEDESGAFQTINETYLLDGISYGNVESRIIAILGSNMPEFQLINLTKMKLSEVFFEENAPENWYKAKVQYISFDEKTQKEKKTPHIMLINAENPKDVFKALTKKLGILNDYQITDINITPILDVYLYQSNDNDNVSNA